MISSAGGRCVACGSSALLNVARMLSRPGSAHFSTDKYAASPVSYRFVYCGDSLQST